MYSKVKIAGHPLHAMLIAFPVAFYTATLVGHLVYAMNGDVFWFRLGHVANWAGVFTALLAAIPGFVDWQAGIPNGTEAKYTGMKHMLLNVGALLLFAINAILQGGRFADQHPPVGFSIVLPLLGMLLTACAGFLGWKLVQVHHVGVDLSPEQERLEPRPSMTSSTPSAHQAGGGHGQPMT